jgi:O-antigen ligase/polysaccharide polymerase Wzy-like membrane protein
VNPAELAPAAGPGGAPDRRLARRVASYWNGTTRSFLVVFGGLLALQSSDRLDASKIAYLMVAGLAFAGSVATVWWARTEPSTNALRPWLIASAVILGLVALSLPVALVNGSTITNFVRDGAAYVLLGAAPWLAVDLARSATTRMVLSAGLLASMLGVASFAISWVQRRGLADLPIDRLTLPSMTLGAAAYCIAIACAVRSSGSKRAAWVVLSVVIVAAFLLTGTRTTFVLLAAPAAVILVDAWKRGRAALRAGALPAIAQVATIMVVLLVSLGRFPVGLGTSPSAEPTVGPTGGVPGGSPGASPPPRDLEDRFSTLDDVTSGRDQSLQLRLLVTGIAWDVFLHAPLLGSGLGHEFSYMETSTQERRGLTLDTPAVVVAKFGIFGFLIFGVLVAAFVQVIRPMLRRGEPSWQGLALIGYGAVLLALLPFGWPPEDKGTSFALVFILALAAADRLPSGQTAG